MVAQSPMATCYEPLSLNDCGKLLKACNGRAIAHVWRGVEPSIFLEVGRLKKAESGRGLEGQICFMVESDWRVEKPRSIQFGSGFSDKRINNHLKSLLGKKITTAEIVGPIPEIVLRFVDNRRFTTFTNWTNQPSWSIGLRDESLVPLDPQWNRIDVSRWIHVQSGRLEIEYCYDDSLASVREAVARMGFV